MNEPSAPSTIVMITPMFCLPGMMSRASAPTIKPTTNALRIVPIMSAPSSESDPDGITQSAAEFTPLSRRYAIVTVLLLKLTVRLV